MVVLNLAEDSGLSIPENDNLSNAVNLSLSLSLSIFSLLGNCEYCYRIGFN